MPEKLYKRKNLRNSFIRYSGLATKMAAIIFAGTFLGDYIDTLNNTTPTFTIIFSLASIFLSLFYVLKRILDDN
ncbi:AtpZ/AtpI family protein [Flavobacteriales bacterium]|nr:AtpZ/AtpI family protein [Flavobacteriales bacterium]